MMELDVFFVSLVLYVIRNEDSTTICLYFLNSPKPKLVLPETRLL